jgi:hypothetical protein
MLNGFNYPLTPKGKSTLNPPPPWYYSADFLSIEFWSDPAAVAAVLPPGLDPDPAAKGHGNALFYDWQFSGANEEYLDPARYQYREFFLLLDALFEGKPVTYCPYIFVDNDAAIARGWTQGYPKRFGQVFQTRYYAATGKAGPALAPGSKFAGSLTSAGRRLAHGLVTLKKPVTDLSALKQKPVVNLLLRHVSQLASKTSRRFTNSSKTYPMMSRSNKHGSEMDSSRCSLQTEKSSRILPRYVAAWAFVLRWPTSSMISRR